MSSSSSSSVAAIGGLEYKTQQATIDWINNDTVHHIEVLVEPRHFETDKINEIQLPMIVVRATRETEEIVGSGVYRMKVEVGLLAQADDTSEATLTGQWQRLCTVLNWDELPARLSDLDDFRCYGVIRGSPSEKETIERHWQFRYVFTAFCMEMD